MNKQKWIQSALEKGFDGFEISEGISRSRSASWFEGSMDSMVTSRTSSVVMRAVYGGKIVTMLLEKVEDSQMDPILEALKQKALYVSETEKDELVGPMHCTELQSAHHWKKPSMDQVSRLLESLERSLMEADPRIMMVNQISWEDMEDKSSITNSKGLNISDTTGAQLLSAAITMQENGEIRDGYAVEVVEDIDGFDQDAFIKRLIEKVAGSLGASSLSSRICPVIFDKDAMGTLLGCFVSEFSGLLIAKGISPLSDKIGQKIWSDKITLIDNPRSQDAMVLKNYDDQGHPTYEKVVVDKGVFQTVLHNTRSALQMGTESTGNGFGNEACSCNMYIVPGKKSPEELMEEMQDGILITDLAGMHAGVDTVTTNFSLQARGFLVEGGKKSRPLTLITVAGNFNELMNEVKAVGSDLDWSYKGLVSPSILFTKASIGGTEK